MRLIHSSDLQIGKVFNYFPPEVAALLQDARQSAVRTLGELAVQHGASTVLLAGDIYDIHPGAVKIADDDGPPVFLLPAPLAHISTVDDLTSYMDRETTPEGAIRIGMAHGSIQGFGSDGEASNYIDPNRAKTAGLAYLAMGDWHRQVRIGDRVWYSGTPEPDQFKLPPDSSGTLCNGGSALLVDITDARALPTITPVEAGKYRWHQVARILTDDSQIDTLEAELRALESDLSKVVLGLQMSGTLSLAGRKQFEARILQGVSAAVCGIRVREDSLVLEPTETDMDEIDRSGFVRVAADRLKSIAADTSDPKQARIATLALRRLYIEHLKQAAGL
jgi:DNA repair exonuclease SbcCD nuclease subunit